MQFSSLFLTVASALLLSATGTIAAAQDDVAVGPCTFPLSAGSSTLSLMLTLYL